MSTVEFYPLTHAFIARAMQETIDHYLSNLSLNSSTHSSYGFPIFDRIALCRRTIARCDATDTPPQVIWDDFSAEKAALSRKWKHEVVGDQLGRKGEGAVRRALEAMEKRRERELEEGEVQEGGGAMLGSMSSGSWERDVDDLGAQYERWDAHVQLQKLAVEMEERMETGDTIQEGLQE